MNAVVAYQPSNGRGVGKALALCEARYLAPLSRPFSHDCFRDLIKLSEWLGLGHPQHTGWLKALEALEIGPVPEALEQYTSAVQGALEGPADQRASRGMVGMLLDAYPNARPPNLEAYADTILHDVADMGFSPEVVAWACREVRRTSKFVPTVAEMVEACTNARDTLTSSLRAADRVAEIMARAHRIAALPEPQKPEWQKSSPGHRAVAEPEEGINEIPF